MSDSEPWDAGSEGAAFIVRARLDPAPFSGTRRLTIRLESVESRKVQHFTDIDSALARLRGLLFCVVGAGGA